MLLTVVPTDNEAPLYYLDWVQKNIDYVNKKTGSEVGYLHIPDIGQPGLNEFTKLYFPQIRRRALIVEGRGVDPDVVVDNDPGKEFKGEDQQLDRAIQEIQEELKTKRYELPTPPPWPNRNPAS